MREGDWIKSEKVKFWDAFLNEEIERYNMSQYQEEMIGEMCEELKKEYSSLNDSHVKLVVDMEKAVIEYLQGSDEEDIRDSIRMHFVHHILIRCLDTTADYLTTKNLAN